MTDTLN